jgi:hypothetical protein
MVVYVHCSDVYVCFRNVSSFSQAQAAPLLENGTGKFGGGELCATCGKTVYFAERVFGGNSVSKKAIFF